MTEMTKIDQIRMAGPRLAIRVAELFRLAAKANASSQQGVADDLGVTPSRLSQIVGGDGNVHVATLARTLAAFGYSVEIVATSADGERLEIKPRASRTRTAKTAGTVTESQPSGEPSVIKFVHPVVTPGGKTENVYSYSTDGVVGKAVDFPMRVETIRLTEFLVSAAPDHEAVRESIRWELSSV